MVSARWQLHQSVKKALVNKDKRQLRETMLHLQDQLQQELRAASVLRTKHTAKLVDRKGSACDPSKAAHLQIETTTTQIDSHWATCCTDLLQQIGATLKSNSTFTVGKSVAHAQANRPAENFQTPKKRTLRDFFGPATPSSTPSTPESRTLPYVFGRATPSSTPSTPTNNIDPAAPSEVVTPVFGCFWQPNEISCGFERLLSQFVESTAQQQGITPTGALDHILYATRGAAVSTLTQTLPLPPILLLILILAYLHSPLVNIPDYI